MNDVSPNRHDKYKAYRARKKAAGLREIRMWVPDVNAPAFRERLAAQIARINASEDDRRLLAELEECTAELWRDIP